MSNRHGIVDSIIDSLAPVNRDGHKFIAIAAGLALLFFLVWPPLAWVCVVAALYIAYFFRDPDRVTPLREGLIIAPADGRIAAIESVQPPAEMGLGPQPRVRISTSSACSTCTSPVRPCRAASCARSTSPAHFLTLRSIRLARRTSGGS